MGGTGWMVTYNHAVSIPTSPFRRQRRFVGNGRRVVYMLKNVIISSGDYRCDLGAVDRSDPRSPPGVQELQRALTFAVCGTTVPPTEMALPMR
eukprot:g11158.t1